MIKINNFIEQLCTEIEMFKLLEIRWFTGTLFIH